MSIREELKKKRAEIDEALGELDALDQPDEPPVSAPVFLAEGGDVPWLIRGLMVEESVNMLVADPKVGKTTLVVQLSLALSVGLPAIWGFNIVGPTPTLVIEAEGSRAAFRARLGTAVASMGLPAPPKWFIQPKDMTDFRLGSSGMDRLIETSRARLVVLDTLGYFHEGDENSASEWKKNVMVPLRRTIARHGCSFVLVHHQVKESEHRSGWQKGRGTTAMFGDCDLWLRMEPVDDTPARKIHVDGNKYGRMGYEIPLTFDAAKAIFVWS